MLTELCLYLNNWFDRNQPHYFGDFIISNGALRSVSEGDILVPNQYYRIAGSVHNDGVYKHDSERLIDETFNGAVWMMAVPPDVISTATEIAMWQAKYGCVDSAAMSPFSGENFAGYGYTKSSSSSGGNISWQTVFSDRLRRYRKI